MIERIITCTNEDNVAITFRERDFAPLVLEDVDGIYKEENSVTTSENTMTDGSTYQGSVTKQRNIVITACSKDEHQSIRQLLYKCFKPKSYGTLLYEEGDERRQIEYQVETVDPDTKGNVRHVVISLLCPDPFFIDLHDTTVTMAGWSANFTFQHQFTSVGEEMGTRQIDKIKVIENDSAADNIGITVTISASGVVTNPAIYLVETGDKIQIGTETKPLTLVSGDKVIITTGTNNKHVYLSHDGTKEEINEYLSEDSEFIQLMRGTNSLGYEAASGDDYMTVTVSFRYRYLGC